MKLTTKGRYAVTAMLDLALRYDKGAVTLADIAKRQGISLSYLEQVFAKLRRNLSGALPPERVEAILELFQDRRRLERLPVPRLIELFL